MTVFYFLAEHASTKSSTLPNVIGIYTGKCTVLEIRFRNQICANLLIILFPTSIVTSKYNMFTVISHLVVIHELTRNFDIAISFYIHVFPSQKLGPFKQKQSLKWYFMVLFVFVKTTDSQCTITAAISTLYKYTILLVSTLTTWLRPMKSLLAN